MKRIVLTLVATAAMFVGGLTFTDSAEARPRRGGWGGYYGNRGGVYMGYRPRYYGGYYGGYYGRPYYRPYYGYPGYYGGYYGSPWGYGYGARYGWGGPGIYLRF